MHKAIRDKVIVLDDIDASSKIIQLMRASEAAATSGTVVSVGHLVDEVKVNDRVAFSKFAGFPMNLGGKKFRVMKQDDVLLVLDESMAVDANVAIQYHSDTIEQKRIIA